MVKHVGMRIAQVSCSCCGRLFSCQQLVLFDHAVLLCCWFYVYCSLLVTSVCVSNQVAADGGGGGYSQHMRGLDW